MGGFGGPELLAAWLGEQGIAAVVDATHPFAQRISALRGERLHHGRCPPAPPRAPGLDAARRGRLALGRRHGRGSRGRPGLGRRVFLTTGRQGLSAFAGLSTVWFLVRCIDPPEPPLPPHCEVLLDRGPYACEGELALIDRFGLDLLVTKDSGGALTAAKLDRRACAACRWS